MGRLCIVSRDSPRLLGYLMVALDKELRGPDAIELVLDRRQPPADASAPSAHRRAERRRDTDILDDALRTRGYVMIDADGSVESEAVSRARRSARLGPGLRVMPALRRVARLAPAVALVIAIAAAAYSVLSMSADRRARILSRVISWAPTLPTRSSVAEPTAPVPAPVPVPAPRVSPGPPPATAAREPAVSPPTPTLPRRTPQAAPAPAPERPEPAPVLPPAARSGTPSALPAPTVSRAETAPKVSPTTAARREAPRPVPAPASVRRETASSPREAASAPSTAAARRDSQAAAAPTPRRTAKTAGPPRVELDARPEGVEAERVIVYTVRLSDSSGRPLDDAAVSLHGWLPNGSDVATSLQSTATPGTYRASVQVGQRTPTNLRVRVTHEGMRFEVPSGR